MLKIALKEPCTDIEEAELYFRQMGAGDRQVFVKMIRLCKNTLLVAPKERRREIKQAMCNYEQKLARLG